MIKLNRNKSWLFSIAALLGIALIWAILPDRIPVNEAVISTGSFEQEITQEGKTRAKDKYVVATPVAGRLLRVTLKAGDRVTAGDLIATLLPGAAPLLNVRTERELQEKLGAAEATLQRAKSAVGRTKAAFDSALIDFKRTKQLTDSGVEPHVNLERADLLLKTRKEEYESAKQEVHAAEHDLEAIRTSLHQFGPGSKRDKTEIEIRSPVSGKILNVTQESETTLPAGAPIVDIGNTTSLELVVDVLSTDAVEIQAGQPVRIEHWGGERPLIGKVRLREPSAFTKVSSLGVEEQRVNILIDITSPFEEWRSLGDGYRVEASILVYKADRVLKVPVGALFRDQDQWAVLLDLNGRSRKRAIEISRRNEREAIVLKGLTEGDRAILYPGDFIQEGSRIKAK